MYERSALVFGAEATGERAEGSPDLDRSALGKALELVQEGLIKSSRFQLAMERRDRTVAMSSLDDIVQLERRIAQFRAELSHSRETSFDEDRQALLRERLTLAAGVIGTGTLSERKSSLHSSPAEVRAKVSEPADAPMMFHYEPQANRGPATSIATRVICFATAITLICGIVASAVFANEVAEVSDAGMDRPA